MTVEPGAKSEGRVSVWPRRPMIGIVILCSTFSLRSSLFSDSGAEADLELSNLNLPKLVLPAEPPAQLRLPDVIVRKDEWRGVQCAVTEPRVAVFRHGDMWTAFWGKAMAPFSRKLANVPAIDFEKDMVVGVFLGGKSTPNYEVEILGVSASAPDKRVVRYRVIKKMQGVFSPPYAIQPFHLKKIPAFTGEILFQND